MDSKAAKKKRAVTAINQLKKLMEAKGLAQAAVALEIRVPLGSLNRWVNARSVPTSEPIIEAIEGFIKNPIGGY